MIQPCYAAYCMYSVIDMPCKQRHHRIMVYTNINYSAHQFWWNCFVTRRDLSITSAISATRHTINYAMLVLLCLFYACPKISNCLSQHSCFLWCRLLCHSNYALALSCALLLSQFASHLLLLSHVPCFVSASRCCSLMCLLCLSITLLLSHVLALSQHHAVALSCALLCLSITLLLSHVPCFVSASRCSCALPCLSMPHGALQCSALSRLLDRSAPHARETKLSNVNGCEILDCPMN